LSTTVPVIVPVMSRTIVTSCSRFAARSAVLIAEAPLSWNATMSTPRRGSPAIAKRPSPSVNAWRCARHGT
jgi:hypothetical protein